MSLFGKPKDEDLRILSEKEIQKRLYGAFHQEDGSEAGQEDNEETVDLKSVEVTPAGMVQSDLFELGKKNDNEAEKQSSEEEVLQKEEETSFSEASSVGESELDAFNQSSQVTEFEQLNEFNDLDLNEEKSFTSELQEKEIEEKEPEEDLSKEVFSVKEEEEAFFIQKTKTEAFSKISTSDGPIINDDLESLVSPKKPTVKLTPIFLSLGQAILKVKESIKNIWTLIFKSFLSFLVVLGQQAPHLSRRFPTKVVLLSLAIIGTALLIFSLWNSNSQKNELNSDVVKSVVSVSKPSSSVVKKEKDVKVTSSRAVSSSNSRAATPPPFVAKKYFSIQVCVAQTREGAEKVIKNLNLSGLKAFVDPTLNRRGSEIFRVMIGKYESYKVSKQDLQKFKQMSAMEPYQDSFIRNLIP